MCIRDSVSPDLQSTLVVNRPCTGCWKTTTCVPGYVAKPTLGVMPILRPSSTTVELGVELKSMRQSMADGGAMRGSADKGKGIVVGNWVEPGVAASAEVPDREISRAT